MNNNLIQEEALMTTDRKELNAAASKVVSELKSLRETIKGNLDAGVVECEKAYSNSQQASPTLFHAPIGSAGATDKKASEAKIYDVKQEKQFADGLLGKIDTIIKNAASDLMKKGSVEDIAGELPKLLEAIKAKLNDGISKDKGINKGWDDFNLLEPYLTKCVAACEEKIIAASKRAGAGYS